MSELITVEWRERAIARLAALGMQQNDLARTIGVTPPTISSILSGGTRRSSHVAAIDRVLNVQLIPAAPDPPAEAAASETVIPDNRIARIAELREARDAIVADIAEHERVRAAIEERLAEAHARRAELEVEIRQLRGVV
jgi:transcriptional regulator with XRE-family HTH domain